MIPIPFWHPQGNPDIWLWVPFTDGTDKDVSIYNRTPSFTDTTGTATINTSGMTVNITSASPTAFTTQISYPIPPTPASPLVNKAITMEGFIKWITTGTTTNPFYIFAFDPQPTSNIDTRQYRGYLNAGDVKFSTSAGDPTEGPTGSHPLAPSGTNYHWAWVMEGTTSNQYFYINGVNVLTDPAGGSGTISVASNGVWAIGGSVNTNGSPDTTHVVWGETRVSNANLYPGGVSFTPPTPGNLPPVP